MGVAINQFAVREIVDLSYGATFLFTTCSVLEIWWLKLQLKTCSEMGVPVLRPPEYRLTLPSQSASQAQDNDDTCSRSRSSSVLSQYPEQAPIPGKKRPCTAFQGATVAASIQTYGSGLALMRAKIATVFKRPLVLEFIVEGKGLATLAAFLVQLRTKSLVSS